MWTAWLVTVFLGVAATVVAWPVRSSRRRRRAVLGGTPVSAERSRLAERPTVGRRGHGQLLDAAGLRAASMPPGGALSGHRGDQRHRPEPVRPPGRHDPRGPVGRCDLPMPHRDGSALVDAVDPRHPVGGAREAVDPRPPAGGDHVPSATAGRPAACRPSVGAVEFGDRPATGNDGHRQAAVGLAPATGGSGGPWEWLGRAGMRSPVRTLVAVVLVSGVAGGVLAGPVAGVALAAYGGLGVRGVLRRQAHRHADLLRRHALEQLAGLAADLRAGLPVPAVRAWAGPARVTALARAAVHLADRTGAPLAELLERVEADARAADRGLAAAAAQAAGARATAWLLAALPLGGIGLGYAIGADPVAVLLHTPVGGGSAVLAIGLQVAGLLWAERLGGTPGRAD